MQLIDLPASQVGQPCACCAEEPARYRDADLGPVCPVCLCLLARVQIFLRRMMAWTPQRKGDA